MKKYNYKIITLAKYIFYKSEDIVECLYPILTENFDDAYNICINDIYIMKSYYLVFIKKLL